MLLYTKSKSKSRGVVELWGILIYTKSKSKFRGVVDIPVGDVALMLYCSGGVLFHLKCCIR